MRIVGRGMRRTAQALLAPVAAFIGGAFVAQQGWARDDPYPSLAAFARVLGYIERDYVDAVSVPGLVQTAMSAVVEQLDGASTYLSPAQFAALQAETRAGLGGVGVVLKQEGRGVIIESVYPQSPAARGGLRAGDIVEKVRNRSLSEMSLTDVGALISGPPGTTVDLRILRKGSGSVVRVVREAIRRSSVSGKRYGEVGYVRLGRFDEGSSRDLRALLERFAQQNPLRGLVIDLRGNPGGLVEQAVKISDLWLSGGVIVTTMGRNRVKTTEQARLEGTEPPYPLAIVVNEGTASAAEIVAGALQDHGRARVFGQRTFGKGSVQTLVELEDGSALKLTVARYLTPSGRSIDGEGIEPDQITTMVRSEIFRLGTPAFDPPLKAALDWLVTPSNDKRPNDVHGVKARDDL